MKKLFLLAALCFACINQAFSTHLMGGSLTYAYYNHDPQSRTVSYTITLNIYRYCEPGSAQFQPQNIYICYDSSLASFPGKPIYQNLEIVLLTPEIIEPPVIGINCPFSGSACVEKGIYQVDVTLPMDTAFHLILATGARNGNIINLETPDSTGMTFYSYIPKSGNYDFNNSPEINDIPVPYVCNGDTVFYNCNSFDPDGDSLVYSFVHPYGYNKLNTDSLVITNPNGTEIAVRYPFEKVKYNPGFSYLQPFGLGGYTGIDTKTGLSKFVIPNQGFYVVAVEIKEYRNGALLSVIRRDIQLIVFACPPNFVPVLQASSIPGTFFKITEEDTLCLNMIFTDADGDTITLKSVGSLFNSSSVDPPATLTSTDGDSVATAQFCWNPICGQARTEPYQFTISALDDGCPPKFSEYIFTIKVDSFAGALTPAVTITQDPDTAFCTGSEVFFKAHPVHGGASPLYNWYLNGVKVGANEDHYSSPGLLNGDVVNLIMTSSSKCAPSPIAGSNDLTMITRQSPEARFTVTPVKQTIFTPHFTFTNQSGNAIWYDWNFGDGTNDTLFEVTHSYTEAGIKEIYLVTRSQDDCFDTAFATVEVTEAATLYIPNSFTPNNDGINDIFYIYGGALPDYSLKIFNRWGQLIFSGNEAIAWDGSYENKKVPAGEYIYSLKFDSRTFNKIYTGTIAVIR